MSLTNMSVVRNVAFFEHYSMETSESPQTQSKITISGDDRKITGRFSSVDRPAQTVLQRLDSKASQTTNRGFKRACGVCNLEQMHKLVDNTNTPHSDLVINADVLAAMVDENINAQILLDFKARHAVTPYSLTQVFTVPPLL